MTHASRKVMALLLWALQLLAGCEGGCPPPTEPALPAAGYYEVDSTPVENGCAIASSVAEPFTWLTDEGAPVAVDASGSVFNGPVSRADASSGPIRFRVESRTVYPEGGGCPEATVEGSASMRVTAGESCTFEMQQDAEILAVDGAGFRLSREIILYGASTGCADAVPFTIGERCSARFDETWTLTRAADPIEDCHARAAVIDASSGSGWRGSVTDPTNTSATATPCDAAFSIAVREAESADDVCESILELNAVFVDDAGLGGSTSSSTPFTCVAALESSSPARWSCEIHDHAFDWPSSLGWSVDGLTLRIDDGGTSSVTFEYADAAGSTTCEATLSSL